MDKEIKKQIMAGIDKNHNKALEASLKTHTKLHTLLKEYDINDIEPFHNLLKELRNELYSAHKEYSDMLLDLLIEKL